MSVTYDPKDIALAKEALADGIHKPCPKCGWPMPTENDCNLYDDYEGTHLCWGEPLACHRAAQHGPFVDAPPTDAEMVSACSDAWKLRCEQAEARAAIAEAQLLETQQHVAALELADKQDRLGLADMEAELDAHREAMQALERKCRELEHENAEKEARIHAPLHCARCGAHHNEIRGGRLVTVRAVCGGCVP